MMRTNGETCIEMLRVWGVDSHVATQALTDLVARGLAIKLGGRRYARYELADVSGLREPLDLDVGVLPTATRQQRIDAQLAAVLEAIRAGHTTARAIGDQLGLGYQPTLRRINTLRSAGKIEETATRHSSRQSYRLIDDH